MKLKLKIKDKEYQIEIIETVKGETRIIVDGEVFVFNENDTQEKVLIAKTFLPKRNFSKKTVKAPITGVISDIFVKKGEFIGEGKKLFLLSSMKMENEIISDFEGRVTEVLVEKHQKVKEGDVLLILK